MVVVGLYLHSAPVRISVVVDDIEKVLQARQSILNQWMQVTRYYC